MSRWFECSNNNYKSLPLTYSSLHLVSILPHHHSDPKIAKDNDFRPGDQCCKLFMWTAPFMCVCGLYQEQLTSDHVHSSCEQLPVCVWFVSRRNGWWRQTNYSFPQGVYFKETMSVRPVSRYKTMSAIIRMYSKRCLFLL